VREHRTRDYVADRVDALHGSGEMRVDLHAATIVEPYERPAAVSSL
jgi:hypothetical protein